MDEHDCRSSEVMGRIKHRLVVCQGSIQLVSAVAAIMTRESENPQADNARDHLLITDLYSPEEQEAYFAAYLQSLAIALRQWTKITWLGSADLREYEKRTAGGDLSAVLSTFRTSLEVGPLDEVYVSKEWQFSNRLAMNAFPEATKICYGDGFGIYYGKGYFGEARRGISRIITRINKAWRGRRGRLKKIACDLGYFIYPHAMGEQPRMPYRRTSHEYASDLMRKASSLVPSEVVGDLGLRISNQDVILLVTTNLTESGQTEEDDEIDAYRQLLLENGLTSKTIVLLKPHPRDSQAKIRRIVEALSQKCDEVIALTDDALFYAPLESLMMRLYEYQWEEIHRRLKIFTFSSAAVTIAGVLGVSPVMGFGETIIRQRFRHKSVEWRLNHEQDLRTAVHRVLGEQRHKSMENIVIEKEFLNKHLTIYGHLPSWDVLFVACDDIYFKEHGAPFMFSASRSNHHVHIHMVNPSQETIDTWSVLSQQMSTKATVTIERIDLSGIDFRGYMTCVRFFRVTDFISKSSARYMIVDIDCLILRQIQFPNEPIGLYYRKNQDKRMLTAGGLVYVAGAQGEEFLKNVTEFICKNGPEWFIDQCALYECSKSFANIHAFNSKLLDWKFKRGSAIWTGKGPRKYSNNRYLRMKHKFTTPRKPIIRKIIDALLIR